MNKFLASVFMFLSSVGLFAQEDLVLLTSADNPPYEFLRGGAVVGFDIDLAKLIAEKLHKTLVIKDMPFSSLIPALMAKQGDFAMAAITPTDARRVNVDFSVPYQNNISAIVLANKEEFEYMKNSNATFPLALLSGKTVGVQLGTHHEVDIRAANITNLEIRRYDNVGTMVAEINKSANGRGSVFALVLGSPEAKTIAKKNSKLCTFPLKFADSFAIAFPKGSPIREDVNKIIELLTETGTILNLEIKWDINR